MYFTREGGSCLKDLEPLAQSRLGSGRVQAICCTGEKGGQPPPVGLVRGWALLEGRVLVSHLIPCCPPDSVKECCGRVLVHCQAGISRSATICLAYLMMKKRVKLEEAFEFVKQRRSIISPNFSFMGQLLQFESQVLATSCAVEAVSPSGTLRERGKANSTPTSQFVFSFPVSVGVHATPSSLPYLHSPITTSPSC